MTESFEKTALNSIGRHRERGRYDYDTVIDIFKAATVVHVSFVDGEGLPQCIPMMGAIERVEEEIYVYLHGASTSRFIKTNEEEGTPICIVATLIDGLVMALTPFSHSIHYRTAILHGLILPFSSQIDSSPEQAKMHALHLITDSIVPGRWDETRLPPTEAEMNATGVLRVRIESASAKINQGKQPNDGRKDLQNEEVLNKTWAGVMSVVFFPLLANMQMKEECSPIRQVALEPVTASYTRVSVPAHISQFGEKYAERMRTAGLPQ